MPTGTALFSTQYWDKALEIGDALREEGPVHRAMTPNRVPVWVLTQFEHARTALRDPRLSKDAPGLTEVFRRRLTEAAQPTELSSMFNPHMLFRDGDPHARLRGLVADKFTRGRVEALRPRIQQVTEQFLDDLPREQVIDLVESFAFPMPLTVICELLGIPDADHLRLRQWTAALMEDVPERTLPASQAMTPYVAGLIDFKRRQPGEDLLSALTQRHAEHDRLTDDELMGTVFLLLVAGHETTTNLISNSVGALLREPSRWQALSSNPDLVPAVVEEVLRYDSPVRMATYRFTTEPVTYGDVTIPSGEIVLVSLLSANRDSRRYTRAEEFDPHRAGEGGHLGFGAGIHYCLGAALGRVEATIALTELVQRFPNACLAVGHHELRRSPSVIMNGYSALPLLLGER